MGSRKFGICGPGLGEFSPNEKIIYDMAIWGIDSGTINEEKLSKLGLVCTGGRSSEKNGMTYMVYRKSGEFYKEFTKEEFDKIDENYIRKERKQKLKKINEAREKI
jgi:hypothetical protein